MTQNQIKYYEHLENVRTHQENERIGWQNARSNAIQAGAAASQAATASNMYAETVQHNRNVEAKDLSRLGEDIRHNKEQEKIDQTRNVNTSRQLDLDERKQNLDYSIQHGKNVIDQQNADTNANKVRVQGINDAVRNVISALPWKVMN